ncbi:MAG: SPOR domain-containing protein, partial [Bacteroidia bacterium]
GTASKQSSGATIQKNNVEPKQNPVNTNTRSKTENEKIIKLEKTVKNDHPKITEPISAEKTNPETTSQTNPATSTASNPIVKTNIPMPIDSGVVFKVQIGAFKDEVPLDMANKFLKIAKKGIHNYNDENGLTIYSVGVFKTYDEAAQVKSEVAKEADINDAFIVAYKDGVKISVEDAKALINK